MTGLFKKDARAILDAEGYDLYQAMAEAHLLRERRHGRSVNLCWIINAKSGHCDQDCGFCSQSRRSEARIDAYPLLGTDEIVGAAKDAAAPEFERRRKMYYIKKRRSIAEAVLAERRSKQDTAEQEKESIAAAEARKS